jgi:hypothetical protein
MTSSFSFQRLKWLIYKQGTEQARFYKIAIPAITGILAFVYLLFITVHKRKLPDEYNRYIFTFGLYIFGGILASTTFQSIHSQSTGKQWLSLPASALEKLLCALFYNTLLFTLVYVLCFYQVKAVALQFTIPINNPFWHYGEKIYGGIFTGMGMTQEALDILLAFFPVQAFFIAGSVWYAKNAFVKTSAAAAALFFLVLLYQHFLSGLLGSNYVWRGNDLTLYDSANNNGSWRVYLLPDWLSAGVRALLLYGLVICFWILTWFRLKEKQL